MKYYFSQTTHIFELDEEILKNAIKKSTRGFRKDSNLYKSFYTYRHLRDLRPKYYQMTPEVVIKKLSSGAGYYSLKNLSRYLMRDLDYQKDQKQVSLIFPDGDRVDADKAEERIKEFSKSLFSAENGFKDEDFEFSLKLEKEMSYLETKAQEDRDKMTQVEIDTLDGYRNGVGNKINIWRYGTEVLYEDEVYKIDHIKKSGKICIKGENGKRSDIDKQKLTPINTIEGIQILPAKKTSKYHERSKDDPSFIVDIVNAKITRNKLKADFDHMVLSPGGDFNQKKALAATRDFMEHNYYRRGFDYIMVEHRDTDNTHYHVIINKRNQFSRDIKIRGGLMESDVIRREYAEMLEVHGIKRSVTRKIDRMEYYHQAREKLAKGEKIKDYFFDRRAKDKDKGIDVSSNPILDAHIVHEKLNDMSEKVDLYFKPKLTRSQYKEISRGLDNAHNEVRDFTKENFGEFQVGMSNWLRSIHKQTADFWDRETTEYQIRGFSDKKIKKRIQKTIAAQEGLQEKLENTYTILEDYKPHAGKDELFFINEWQEAAAEVWAGHERSLAHAKRKFLEQSSEPRATSAREVRDILLDHGKKANTLSLLQTEIKKSNEISR